MNGRRAGRRRRVQAADVDRDAALVKAADALREWDGRTGTRLPGAGQ